MNYKLENVYRKHKEDPKFYSPKQDHLEKLEHGDYVRLILIVKVGVTNETEEVLVKIVGVLPRAKFVGRLCSVPFLTKTIRYGDEIAFNRQHVYYVEGSGESIPKSESNS